METLGSVSVIASDKTGTLTEGRMAVQEAVLPDGVAFTVTGTGYEPAGTVHRDGQAWPRRPDSCATSPWPGCSATTPRCCRRRPSGPTGWAAGDPLEAALVAFAARCGLDPQPVRAQWPRVDEQPFDQDTRRMVTVHRTPEERYLVVCKGAPESVLAAPLVQADTAGARAAARRRAPARR